ncbi:ammonium transporter [Xanthobacter tagetidis]|jgi:Amt family ammonium transporter|uniref:Ammonium transporter n=1 Tax=Xanthobacter tagetidis TaxID=60216 RepID=A0A3L7A8G4_9HYPH|nr:ammonium transporter [Xanthobacter tagetidis]MBB6309318.1 Amt family ammonium transporter [Xanthobacter tagetidis]RLP76633.1 ammonium transporter [Xanthobacter tagetidis]
MTFKTWTRAGIPALLAAAAIALPALAQTPEAAPAAAAVSTVNKGDVAWMMTSTVLVLLMTVPGLALFYGGLVRAKNMLSVLMQVLTITAVMMLVWVLYGYSLAFTSGNAFIGGFEKAFLAGVTVESLADTFTKGVQIPEFAFIAFQMTFAAITPALAVGAFPERIKFPAVILFAVLWGTFVYFPIAHMVWFSEGYLFTLGALDFAGGTVVHINAGIAGLVGCLIVGKRIGYGKEQLPPHSLPFTMIGASLLWVGWFGFNVGSNLEANGLATLVMVNTFLATAGAIVGWLVIEWLVKGAPSMLGGASGAVAGLVAITPACGASGPMGAIVLGIIAAVVCFFFCTTVKNALGYDDSLDVFGVHGIGGIIGAIGTGILVSPALGGAGVADYEMVKQVLIQGQATIITVVWSGVVSAIIFFVLNIVVGLRPSADVEREGLDINEHGERAYHS